MTPERFVKELEKAAPSREDLRALGLSESEAAEMRRTYKAVANDRPAPPSSNPVADFLSRWDWRRVEIGLIQFSRSPKRIDVGDIFGRVDDDLLVFDAKSHEIIVLDYENPKKRLWKAAANLESFFEALIIAARYLATCAVDESVYNDRSAANDAARRCADKAGGAQCLQFYERLFD